MASAASRFHRYIFTLTLESYSGTGNSTRRDTFSASRGRPESTPFCPIFSGPVTKGVELNPFCDRPGKNGACHKMDSTRLALNPKHRPFCLPSASISARCFCSPAAIPFLTSLRPTSFSLAELNSFRSSTGAALLLLIVQKQLKLIRKMSPGAWSVGAKSIFSGFRPRVYRWLVFAGAD